MVEYRGEIPLRRSERRFDVSDGGDTPLTLSERRVRQGIKRYMLRLNGLTCWYVFVVIFVVVNGGDVVVLMVVLEC